MRMPVTAIMVGDTLEDDRSVVIKAERDANGNVILLLREETGQQISVKYCDGDTEDIIEPTGNPKITNI